MLSGNTLYEVLGLQETASKQDITKAYKKLALEHHPDKNPDNKEQAEENFKKICEAYEILGDAEKRRQYDDNGGFNVGGGDFSRQQAENVFARACSDDEVFAELFRRRYQGGSDPGMAPTHGGIGRETPNDMGPNGGMRGSGGGRPAGMSSLKPGVLPAWTSVTVRGLKGAAQHNGKVGQIESYDAESGRYAVRLPSGEGVMIKFDNLLQRAEVECVGLAIELNGKAATISGYDEKTDRYQVDIRGAGRHPLQLDNLILPAGARGKVRGLTSAAGSKWNDHVGQVMSFDRDAGRYVVQVTREDQVKIRPVNLRL